jgi:mannitol/fructose-specific phosphotransferase system IIA component (Ntr-type)
MGFFVNQVDPETLHYNLRRDNASITMLHESEMLTLQTDKENSLFVRRMMHEAAFYLKQSVSAILSMEDLHANLDEQNPEDQTLIVSEMTKLLQVENIIPRLKYDTKEGIIWEMIDHLHKLGKVKDAKSMYYTVLARDKYLSSGLTHGLAIPHAHTNDVSAPLVVFGIKPRGVNFCSIDGKPSHLIFLILTPEIDAHIHIRLLANISRLSRQTQTIQALLCLTDPEQIRTETLKAIENYKP